MLPAVMSLLLLVVLAVLTPAQVGGLIPPRYDLAPNRWWEKAAVRPGSSRHQTTSYRVYNSAGPLPPYSFAVNSAGPKPSCRPRSSCVGYQSPAGYPAGSAAADPRRPAVYVTPANSAGPRPPPRFQTNSAGPKPTPSYQSAVDSAGSKPPANPQTAARNSVGPQMPLFTFNSVGPKFPPGYTFSTNSVGPKLPAGSSHSFGSGAGPKPPQGYSFTAGPKMRPDAVLLSATPAPAPDTVSVRTRVQTGTQGPGYSQARAHAEAGKRIQGRPWSHLEKETQAAAGRKASTPSERRRPCGGDVSCPAYQLTARTARYEVRLYPATVWVSYITATENRLLAEMEAQAGIEDFLAGANSLGVLLSRSYPTLTQLHSSAGRGYNRQQGGDFSVSVPLLEDADPPRPVTDQVVLDSVEQQKVFVMKFWARPWKLTDRSLRLRTRRFSRRLRRHGQTFLDEYFYLAKYKESSSERRSYYEIWLYGTPHESTHRFRPTGKRLLDRRSNLTIATMRRLCRGRECPRFEVLNEFPGGIQKRHYYNAAFATSRLERCESSLTAIWHSLMPLHLYREGINTHLERIERTRPAGVLRVWQEAPRGRGAPANGTSSSCHMTVMVYLPRRLHRTPPNTGSQAPTIGLSYIHELTVYVQTAGDLDLGSGHLEDHVTSFHARLDRLGLCYRPDEYFVAVYDDVQRYHGRLNEIWIVAQRCQQQDEGAL